MAIGAARERARATPTDVGPPLVETGIRAGSARGVAARRVVTAATDVVADTATEPVGARGAAPGSAPPEVAPPRALVTPSCQCPLTAIGGRGRQIATTDGKEAVPQRRE